MSINPCQYLGLSRVPQLIERAANLKNLSRIVEDTFMHDEINLLYDNATLLKAAYDWDDIALRAAYKRIIADVALEAGNKTPTNYTPVDLRELWDDKEAIQAGIKNNIVGNIINMRNRMSEWDKTFPTNWILDSVIANPQLWIDKNKWVDPIIDSWKDRAMLYLYKQTNPDGFQKLTLEWNAGDEKAWRTNMEEFLGGKYTTKNELNYLLNTLSHPVSDTMFETNFVRTVTKDRNEAQKKLAATIRWRDYLGTRAGKLTSVASARGRIAFIMPTLLWYTSMARTARRMSIGIERADAIAALKLMWENTESYGGATREMITAGDFEDTAARIQNDIIYNKYQADQSAAKKFIKGIKEWIREERQNLPSSALDQALLPEVNMNAAALALKSLWWDPKASLAKMAMDTPEGLKLRTQFNQAFDDIKWDMFVFGRDPTGLKKAANKNLFYKRTSYKSVRGESIWFNAINAMVADPIRKLFGAADKEAKAFIGMDYGKWFDAVDKWAPEAGNWEKVDFDWYHEKPVGKVAEIFTNPEFVYYWTNFFENMRYANLYNESKEGRDERPLGEKIWTLLTFASLVSTTLQWFQSSSMFRLLMAYGTSRRDKNQLNFGENLLVDTMQRVGKEFWRRWNLAVSSADFAKTLHDTDNAKDHLFGILYDTVLNKSQYFMSNQIGNFMQTTLYNDDESANYILGQNVSEFKNKYNSFLEATTDATYKVNEWKYFWNWFTQKLWPREKTFTKLNSSSGYPNKYEWQDFAKVVSSDPVVYKSLQSGLTPFILEGFENSLNNGGVKPKNEIDFWTKTNTIIMSYDALGWAWAPYLNKVSQWDSINLIDNLETLLRAWEDKSVQDALASSIKYIVRWKADYLNYQPITSDGKSIVDILGELKKSPLTLTQNAVGAYSTKRNEILWALTEKHRWDSNWTNDQLQARATQLALMVNGPAAVLSVNKDLLTNIQRTYVESKYGEQFKKNIDKSIDVSQYGTLLDAFRIDMIAKVDFMQTKNSNPYAVSNELGKPLLKLMDNPHIMTAQFSSLMETVDNSDRDPYDKFNFKLGIFSGLEWEPLNTIIIWQSWRWDITKEQYDTDNRAKRAVDNKDDLALRLYWINNVNGDMVNYKILHDNLAK